MDNVSLLNGKSENTPLGVLKFLNSIVTDIDQIYAVAIHRNGAVTIQTTGPIPGIVFAGYLLGKAADTHVVMTTGPKNG